MSIQTLRNQELREHLIAELPDIDMVVVDEAHHARNPGTQTSETLRELCSIGNCVLLLTATPLHLGSRDLFTLLNALRPTEFRDAEVFDRELRHHRGVIEAELLVRTRVDDAVRQAAERLEEIFLSGIPEKMQDPLARNVIADMRDRPPEDPRGWVELERQVQDLHPLATILTRTRKRDVQEQAPTRRAGVHRCQWTAEEDDAYRRLVSSASSRGWIRQGLGFAEIQRARQAASCLPAAYDKHLAGTGTTDDEAVELSDILPSDAPGGAVAARTSGGASDSGRWSGTDSKYAKLREILDIVSTEEPQEA